MKEAIIMVVLLSVIILTPSSTSAYTPERGTAKYYNRGLMESVASRRGLSKPRGVDGLASVPNCSRLGKIAHASINGRAAIRHVILGVVDPLRDFMR